MTTEQRRELAAHLRNAAVNIENGDWDLARVRITSFLGEFAKHARHAFFVDDPADTLAAMIKRLFGKGRSP